MTTQCALTIRVIGTYKLPQNPQYPLTYSAHRTTSLHVRITQKIKGLAKRELDGHTFYEESFNLNQPYNRLTAFVIDTRNQETQLEIEILFRLYNPKTLKLEERRISKESLSLFCDEQASTITFNLGEHQIGVHKR